MCYYSLLGDLWRVNITMENTFCSLNMSTGPPLLSTAVCVLKITCVVCCFAKKEKKSIVKCICEVLQTVRPRVSSFQTKDLWLPSLSGIHRRIWEAQNVQGNLNHQTLQVRGSPLVGIEQWYSRAPILYPCVHLLKQPILRREKLIGLDLVTCPLIWEGDITWALQCGKSQCKQISCSPNEK